MYSEAEAAERDLDLRIAAVPRRRSGAQVQPALGLVAQRPQALHLLPVVVQLGLVLQAQHDAVLADALLSGVPVRAHCIVPVDPCQSSVSSLMMIGATAARMARNMLKSFGYWVLGIGYWVIEE